MEISLGIKGLATERKKGDTKAYFITKLKPDY